MILTQRQQAIIEIVKKNAPITGEAIADQLQVTRAALRSDLSILTMMGYLAAKPRVGYCYQQQNHENDFLGVLARYRVKDIFARPVIVPEECSAYDAIVSLFTEDTGSLIVVDGSGALTGIVSRKDLLKATMGHSDIQKIPVSVIMTRMPNIIYVHKEDAVLHALSKIVEHEVDSLPVIENGVDGRLEVIGRISKTNLVRLMMDLTLGHKTAEVSHE